MFQGKIVCVGRNYAAHAKELNNPVPEMPLLFMKPATAWASVIDAFSIPQQDCHYEAELAVRIAQPMMQVAAEQAMAGVDAVALALDLTKRGLQAKLKEKGHPWELAKAFDGACPMTPFLSLSEFDGALPESFTLDINGERRQHGFCRDMLTPVPTLLSYISQYFSLMPGDVVLTGTPEGVGELHTGDRVRLAFDEGRYWEGTATGQGSSG